MANTQHFRQAVNNVQTAAILWHQHLVDDLAALRAAIVAITAKLDADTVTGLDDDYAAECNPPALKTVD